MSDGGRYDSERYARAWRKWWAEGLELGMTVAGGEPAQMSSHSSHTNEPQRFPIGESCDLLGIDRMTLKRWLDEAHMEPQTDTIDKRYKYLTREQILTLARRHNRIVRLEQQAPGPRLSRREREMAARVEAVEDVVRQHSVVLQQMMENQQLFIRQMAEVLRRLDGRFGEFSPIPAPAPAPVVPTTVPPDLPPPSPPSRTPSGWVSTSRNPLPPLPEGWVSFRAFARSLGVPDTTALRWAKLGKWPQPHRGAWASGPSGTYAITMAYDPEQQRVVRELLGKPEPSGDGDVE